MINGNSDNLYLDGNSLEIQVPPKGAFHFHGILVATSPNSKLAVAIKVEGLVRDNAGAAVLIGTPNISEVGADSPGKNILTVSTSGMSLQFTMKNNDGNTMRYVLRLETSEVIFP